MNPSERNAPYAAWRELVKAADSFYAERPWEILTEETIFGVLDPESGQTLYCTILGQLGEVYGMAVYPGPGGWRSHLKTRDPEYKGVEPLFYLCALLISFENKRELSKQDRRMLKNMGRSYRGRRWPQFRSYRPGYMEELPGKMERFQMTLALQGAAVMLQWQRQGKAPQAGPGRFPLLCYDPEAGKWSWRGGEFDSPTHPSPSAPALDEIRLQNIKRKAGRDGVWEGSVYQLPMLTGQKKGPDYFPCMGIWADHHSGYVFSQELTSPEHIGSALIESLFQAMEAMGRIPEVIRVDRDCYRNMLSKMGDLLGIRVELAERLPALQDVIKTMQTQFMGRPSIQPAVPQGSREEHREVKEPSTGFGPMSPEEAPLLEEFIHWLLEGGLKRDTVRTHFDTAYIFTNEFLSCAENEPVSPEDGALYADRFFRDWLPASWIRISPNKVDRMIAGLKKLYAFLDEYGYMDGEEMKAFRQMIRNNRQEWKEIASGRNGA
jgi:hypothetical protein